MNLPRLHCWNIMSLEGNKATGSLFHVSISSEEEEDTLSEYIRERGRFSVASSLREKSSTSDDSDDNESRCG